MARSVHRLLSLLLLAACLLRLPVSDCSSAAASSPAAVEPAGGVPPGDDALLHHHQLDAEARAAAAAAGRSASMEVADYGKTGADDGATAAPSSFATPAWAEGVVVAWQPRPQASGGRALVGEGMRPAAVLRRSKLARRFLAGVDVDDAGTDGAAASCHSSSVHINCPPASSKP